MLKSCLAMSSSAHQTALGQRLSPCRDMNRLGFRLFADHQSGTVVRSGPKAIPKTECRKVI
jgi:hypothetical protein